VIKLQGLDCYTVGTGSKAIILFTDIFGWKSGGHRALCDHLALQGYTVIMADHFDGKEVAIDQKTSVFTMIWNIPSMYKRIKTVPWTKASKDIFDVIIPHLEKQGVSRIGCLGFCWGAWVAYHASANEKIRCAVSAHPSLQVASMFSENATKLVEEIKSPQLVMPAGNDKKDVKKGGLVEQTLKKTSIECVLEEFPTMKHGWVTRGKTDNDNVEKERNRAIDLMVNFFKKHL